MKVVLGKIFCRIQCFIKSCINEYHKSQFKSIGNNVRISDNGSFTYDMISLGDDVLINVNVVMQTQKCGGEIIIGNHVAIGPGVGIYAINHDIKTCGIFMTNKHKSVDKNVVIEDDVWIGANAVILPGVKIGKGSVVGAGAIVTRDVPEYSIYTGANPLNIRPRFSKEEISEHEKILSGKIRNA